MKKTPHRVVIEFSPTCDVLRAACTCPAGLGLQGKGKCNHVGGVLFAIEDFSRRGLQQNPEPLTCTSRLSVWVVPRNQSVAAKPLDKVLIRKIRFGKKNIRTQAKIIKFDPRAPQQRTRDPETFKKLCNDLQNCLSSSSFFLFHDIKSKCAGNDTTSENVAEDKDVTPFTDSYDIATKRFKEMLDEHVSSWTVSEEEIKETEMSTRGQSQNPIWFEKRKSILTASNFGKAAKTKVEPSNKLKAMLYSNFTTEAVQNGIESEEKAVKLYMYQREMLQQVFNLKVDEVGLLLSRIKPYLGASLDRMVTNMDTNEKWDMEIKSAFSKAGMFVDEACKSKTFCLEKLSVGTIRLKRTHDYYIQVQGQLFCSNFDLKGIIFLVYFVEDKPLFKEKIFFDSGCWHEYLPKIDYFFKRALLPEMLTRRVHRGKLLYLHGGWIPYGNYTCTSSGLKLTFHRAH